MIPSRHRDGKIAIPPHLLQWSEQRLKFELLERYSKLSKHTERLSKSNGKSNPGRSGSTSRSKDSEPTVVQTGPVVQAFGKSIHLPNGLSEKVRDKSIELLNQVLADTMTLRDLYKKHHWQVSGRTFYQLHLLFDKHFQEQADLVDTIAERIQLLGGISIAMAADVAEMTKIDRPPRGREEVPVQLARLLKAHEMIMNFARSSAKDADAIGDPGTNDLLVSDLLRLNELQSWFLAEHLVNLPLISSESSAAGKGRSD